MCCRLLRDRTALKNDQAFGPAAHVM